ncbi:MAG: hypothetical protein J6K73_00805 [Clostridia bacterium]|nr:hypothetical protein [Clostridia bacterium]MBP3648300.1 hypothetical protein [Clostridia bacterium]
MTAYESWQEQREELRKEISNQQELSGIIYATRHALLQTEQNVLASQNDDVLRQQMGVLFALLKNSISLLNVPVSSTAWTAASRRNEKRLERGFPFLLSAGLLLLAVILWNYAKHDLLGWILPLGALALCMIGLLLNRKDKAHRTPAQQPQLKVTQSIEPEQLLSAIDAQILMIDRCTNDFSYLNQSLRAPSSGIGVQNLDAVSDLLEVLYAYDDDLRQQADEAISHLLSEMGLETMEYNQENQKLFNQLPSKNMTRTLCPAILSAEDHRLLRRGTAVVSTDAA